MPHAIDFGAHDLERVHGLRERRAVAAVGRIVVAAAELVVAAARRVVAIEQLQQRRRARL